MALTVTYEGFNITSEVSGIDLRCGRSRELDEFQSVSGSVTLHNFDRNFDPPFFTTENYLLMESGDYLLLENGDRIILAQGSQASGSYGVMTIGGTLTIDDGAVRVFTGHVEDINYDWDNTGAARVTLVLGDALTSLASTKFSTEWTPTNVQRSGARITEALSRSDVGMASKIGTIDNGHHRLQGAVVANGTNVLQYVQLVSRTEYGKFYVDAAGTYQFRGRFDFPSTTTAADFDDTGVGFKFSDVGVNFGSELRAWGASIQRLGGITQTATATASPPATLGQRTISQTGLLFRSDAESKARAEFLSSKFSAPEATIASLRVNLHDLGTSPRATIAGLDIHDSVSLTWTPQNTGAQVTQTLVIEGRTFHALARTGEAWVELQLSAMPDTNYFTLDTDLLDSGVPLAP